jgi:SAM-dependent methyltransferase
MTSAHQQTAPLPWVARWLQCLPENAHVLDFAAGSGRHSHAARDCGFSVVAADRNAQALAEIGREVQTLETDLEGAPWPFAPASFDAVIVSNYLHRSRLDLLGSLLRPGGLLIYQTFAIGNERFGRPSNPAFLLQPGELLAMAARSGLEVIAYEHGVQADPDAVVQRIAAARPRSGDSTQQVSQNWPVAR